MFTACKYIFAQLFKQFIFFHIYLCHLCQFPHSGVAMSVYTFWEAFAKLEKRLNEGQGCSTRGQPMHEVRSKLDKFLKTLALNGIQVCFCVLLCFCVEWLYSSTLPQHSSAFATNTQVKKLTLILICYHRNTECLHMIQSNLFLLFLSFLLLTSPHSCKMSGPNSKTGPSPEEGLGSAESKSLTALCWPNDSKTVWWPCEALNVCLCCSLILWCKNMKTQLCGIYRQCFLSDSGPDDTPRHLSPGLRERAQTMVQWVSVSYYFRCYILGLPTWLHFFILTLCNLVLHCFVCILFVFLSLSHSLREQLMDWKDFLLVKSKRNITMVSYPLSAATLWCPVLSNFSAIVFYKAEFVIFVKEYFVFLWFLTTYIHLKNPKNKPIVMLSVLILTD